MEALLSDDSKVRARAASSLQFFQEYAAESAPKILELLRTEPDEYLNQIMASSLFGISPGSGPMRDLLEVMQVNPATAKGVRYWSGMQLHQHPDFEDAVVAQMVPFLQHADAGVRFNAALVLAGLPTQQQASALPALLPALQMDYGSGDQRPIEALMALKALGTQARSAADAVREFGAKAPGAQEWCTERLQR
jgi:HEAT repeat protein